MTKFNAWQYDADVTHLREYSHSKFKIFYDRIPFKMDDFFTHLFTGSFNFLHSYTGKWAKTNVAISQLKSRSIATRVVVNICSTLKP